MLGVRGAGIGGKSNSFNSMFSIDTMVIMEIIDTLRGMTGIGYDKEREKEFYDDDLDDYDESYDDD